MKIISNNECYIQGYDLEHLLYNDSMFPVEMYVSKSGSRGHLGNLNKYYKITDKHQIEYLKNCGIVADFCELGCENVDALKQLIEIFKKGIYDEENKIDSCKDSCSYQIDSYKKIKQLEYLILQVKEMIALKECVSKINYPCIPNPCCETVKSEGFNVCLSVDGKSIVIYSDNGKSLKDLSPEFGVCAYKIIKEDDNSTLEGHYSDDLKYYIVGQKQMELEKPTTFKLKKRSK